MNWRLIPALLALLAPNLAKADLNLAPQPASSHLCRQAIAVAERAHGIPSQLLAAIARVESGRRDQGSGSFNPWPWTINLDGQGSFYESKGQAVATANAMRPRVARSIDVGCMQISLTMHPTAFASMDQAFDPRSNAEYGARFLVQLYEKTGSWPRAVEYYHSATPGLGREYQEKVYAAWPEEKKLALATEPLRMSSLLNPPSLLPHAVLPIGLASPGLIRPVMTQGTMGQGTMGQGVLTQAANRPMFSSLFRQSAPHVVPRMPAMGGDMPAGRTLDAYRLTPVRLALRAPRLSN